MSLQRSCARQRARSAFVEENREETARILARPDRVGVDADIIRRTLDGRLKISPDGTMRQSGRYLLVGREDAARPDPVQAAWLYAQMARWGQTQLGKDALRTAMAVFRPDLYDAALGKAHDASSAEDAHVFCGFRRTRLRPRGHPGLSGFVRRGQTRLITKLGIVDSKLIP